MRQQHKLATLLAAAGLARSTFYYQRRVLQHPGRERQMKERIQDIYNRHRGRYGYRRIIMELRKKVKQAVNSKRVQRLMRHGYSGRS